MKLTDVARASLNELASDYEDWLLRHGLVPWHKNSMEAKEVFVVRLDSPNYKDDWVYESCVHLLKQQSKFDRWLLSDNSVVMANCLIILIRRTMKMLAGQLQSQADRFEQTGGFREKLTQIRTEAIAKNENAPVCPKCNRPMTLRKAREGKNAGKEFWGCTGYPECTGVRKVDENRKEKE